MRWGARRGGRRRRAASFLALVACWLAAAGAAPQVAAAAAQPTARAVLFYSPGCGHCRDLLSGPLPRVLDDYRGRLRILAVDATEPTGARLFKAAVVEYRVPPPDRGVPALVIGDRFLAGVGDISEELPILVAQHLGRGGVGWPGITGLRSALASGGAVVTSSPSRLLAATEPSGGFLDRLARDRWANMLALIVLAGMVAALASVAVRAIAAARHRGVGDGAAGADLPSADRRRTIAGAVLLVLGLGVSGYLTYVHATSSATLCGPLGDCDVVQQSSWSRVAGLPVAYIGLAGYVAMTVAFVLARVSGAVRARLAAGVFFALAAAGTLFSLYLTVLEPFVLGATCVWCLDSAVIVTLLLLIGAADIGLARVRVPHAERPPDPQEGRRRATRDKAGS